MVKPNEYRELYSTYIALCIHCKNLWRLLVKPLNIIISRVSYTGWVISSVFSTAQLLDEQRQYSLHLEQFLNSLPPSFVQLRLKVIDLFSPGNWYLGIGKNVRLCASVWPRPWTNAWMALNDINFEHRLFGAKSRPSSLIDQIALNVSKLRPFNY